MLLFHYAAPESEVDEEVIDERPLENKSDNYNNLVNHVAEQTHSVTFADEDGPKVRYHLKNIY